MPLNVDPPSGLEAPMSTHPFPSIVIPSPFLDLESLNLTLHTSPGLYQGHLPMAQNPISLCRSL